jgi:hypothetical protein
MYILKKQKFYKDYVMQVLYCDNFHRLIFFNWIFWNKYFHKEKNHVVDNICYTVSALAAGNGKFLYSGRIYTPSACCCPCGNFN